MQVGIDLIEISEIKSLVDNERACERVFTAHEIADCRDRGQDAEAAFARRFAAKEALIKAFGETPGHLSRIEIRNDDQGRPIAHWPALESKNLAASISLSSNQDSAIAIALVFPRQA